MNFIDLLVLYLVFFLLGMALHWFETALSGYYFAFRVSKFLGRKIFSILLLFIYYRSYLAFFLIPIGWFSGIPPLEMGILFCSYIIITMLFPLFFPLDKIISNINHFQFLKNKNPIIQSQISHPSSLSASNDTFHDAIDLQISQVHDKLLADYLKKVYIAKSSQNSIICPNCHYLNTISSNNTFRVFCDSCGVLLTLTKG